MPPPITTTRRPTGSAARSPAWRSSAMKSTAGRTPALAAPSASSARTPPRPMPRNTASKSARSVVERHVAPEPHAGPELDAADAEQPVDLGLGEAVHRLVGGDAELVEPAALGRPSISTTSWPSIASRCAQASPAGPAPTTATRLPVGAARANGWPAFAISASVAKRCSRPISTGRPSAASRTQASSQSVSVGQTRAHMPPRMFCDEDGPRRRLGGAAGDLADEQRDVDRGRAGGDAGRVVAEVAAVGGDQRLVRGQRRGDVGEVRGERSPAPAARRRCRASAGWVPWTSPVFRRPTLA